MFSTSYQVAFVDSVTSSPTTRLDLVNGAWSVQREGTDLSPPPLRRAVVSTLLTDGQQIPAAAYDNRVITLRLHCTATTDDAVALALQDLAQELDRASNLLKWQPGTTQPVFFRTFRADFSSVIWDPVQRFATVSIPAEPFGYGLKQLAMPPLNANPYFETDTSNWTLIAGTSIARSTAQAHEGSASLLLTPDGVAATAETSAEFVAATAGNVYTVTANVYPALSSTAVVLAVAWYDAGQALLSTSVGSTSTLGPGWSEIGETFTAPASTAYARLRVRVTGTPGATRTLYIDEAMLTAARAVNNDPAATANGLYLDVTGVLGDVETPLFLRVWFSSVSGRTSAVGIRRRGTPANMPLSYQWENASDGTDTSTQTNDGSMSGAGSNYKRCTFATSTANAMRVSAQPWLGTISKDLRGTYRAFTRLRHSVAGDIITVQLLVSYNGGTVRNSAVTLPNISVNHIVDLGLVAFPGGADPVTDGYSGTEATVNGNLLFQLYAARTSGSGNLDLDYLVLVPADDRLAMIAWSSPGGPTDFVVDSARSLVYGRGSVNDVRSEPAMAIIGGLPMVSPNVTNRLVWLRDVGGTSGQTESLTAQSVISPYYWPRYLYARPLST